MKATIAVLVAVAALVSVVPADASARIVSNPVNNSTYIGNGHWGGYGVHGSRQGGVHVSRRVWDHGSWSSNSGSSSGNHVPRPVWDHGSWSPNGNSANGQSNSQWPYGYHNYWGAWRTTSDGRVDPIVLK